MLGNLDNEVIFKKAFTDKTVFLPFLQNILSIEIEVEKIKTEKKFIPKIGYIDFELDFFAESIDKRVCIEIQRIEYDHHFHRFLHYFLILIAKQQKNAKEYHIEQTVYMIAVLTVPYAISEKNRKPILDEFLLLHLNPQSLRGEMRDLYGHQFVCLNPNHPDEDTPKKIRDWLDLIYQSIYNPQRPVLNTENEGIKPAIELISFDNLSPDERIQAKNKEASKIVLAKTEHKAKQEEKIEIAVKLTELGSANGFVAKAIGLTLEQIEKLRTERTK